MEAQRKRRIFAAAIDAVLLLCGCIAAVTAGALGRAPNSYYLYSVGVLSIVELCFFALFFVVEIISAFKISDSTWHTVFLAGSLFCYQFTGADFTQMLTEGSAGLYGEIVAELNFLFFGLSLFALFCFWNYTYKLALPRVAFVGAFLWLIVCFGMHIGLGMLGLGAVAFALFAAGLVLALVTVYRRIPPSRADAMFYTTEALFYAMTGSALITDLCAACDFPASGFASFQALPAIAAFLAVYVAFAMRTDRAALRASEYKLRYEQIKARALREQIKPHFVFNVLASIQSLYRIGLEEGDRAITLLSRHLRTNIEASDTDLIPFDEELDNIQVYIDLENMRLSKKVNVIFDIDCTDFSVPVLSLQPYIENAIKYSRVNEREDGYVRITSRRTEAGVLLEVADNGVGFDTHAVLPSSCGIRNASERFSMLMGAEPKIESRRGEGTTVTILIASRPSKEEEA